LSIAEPELRKKSTEINLIDLQTMLDISIRSSSAFSDPFCESIRCALMEESYIRQLKSLSIEGIIDNPIDDDRSEIINGLEAFSLDILFEWPLSLFLSESIISKYQILFRYLFYTKYVENILIKCWVLHQKTKYDEIDFDMSPAFTLRIKMLHFVQNLYYYMINEIIEPLSNDFMKKMEDIETVDNLLEVHDEFISTCINNCILLQSDLITLVTKIYSICINFYNYSNRFNLAIQEQDTVEIYGIYSSLTKFEENFDLYLRSLIEAVESSSYENNQFSLAFINIRLNFNDYYTYKFFDNKSEEQEQEPESNEL